jgi:glycosyltransferase involved in cell wall biosynthesis/GT2 family glycosyltransferase
MRICLVSREFAPFNGWGAGTYASLMAQAMSRSGHEVHVLTGDGACVREGEKVRPGVRFHPVQMRGFPMDLRCYAAEPQRYAMAVYHALLALHEEHAFDYVEFPDFLGEAYFCLRARRTLGHFDGAVLGVRLHMTIRQIRDINQDHWIDVERATVEHMEDWSIRHADALVAPCEAMQRYARGRFGDRIARVPLEVVRYPFPLEEQRREMGVATRTEPPRPLVVVPGRFERRKGTHVMAQACERLWQDGRDFELRFVGDDTPTGPVEGSMREWALGLVSPAHRENVAFAPRAKRDELGSLYADATVVCVPSVWENFPFACIEAMALGACVVGSDQGGMGELIEDGVSGALFAGGDVASLTRVLGRVLDDAPLRARLAGAAPRRVGAMCDPQRVTREVAQVVARLRSLREPRRTAFGGAAPRTIAHPGTPARGSRAPIAREGAPRDAAPSAPAREPLVAVIVPVYDTHEFLQETLDSLREQTFQDWEVVLCDDGSTRDETRRALAQIASRSDERRLRVVRIEHAGPGPARDAAIAHARAPWILPLDSDDMLAPDALETLVAAKRRNPGAPFITAPLRSFADDPNAPLGGWIPLGGDAELMTVINAAASVVSLMDKAMVREVGGHDPTMRVYEDWDLYCRLVERFGEGEVVPEFLVLHRLRPQSAMHTLSRKEHHLQRARLMAKYPRLSPDPGRTLRFLAGDCIIPHMADRSGEDAGLIQIRAKELLHTNIRYRIADTINDSLKRMGLQRMVKAWYGKVAR